MIFFLRLKSPKNIFKTLNQGIVMFKPMNLNPKSLQIKSSKIFAKIPLKKTGEKTFGNLQTVFTSGCQ